MTLVLVAGFILAVSAMLVCARSDQAGIWLVGFALVIDGLRIPVPSSSVAGFTVTPTDVVMLGLVTRVFVSFVTRDARILRWEHKRASLCVSLLSVVLIVQILRGVVAHGVGPALNDARPFIYFAIGALYGLTLAWSNQRIVRSTYVAATIVFTAYVIRTLILIAQRGIITSATSVDVNGVLIDARPIYAWHALLLVQVAIAYLAVRPRERAWEWLRYGLLFVSVLCVVLLQHRTIWVVALICLVALLLNDRGVAIDAFRLRTVAVIVVGAALALVTSLGPLGEALRSSISEIGASNSTFAFRTTSWRELLSEQLGHSASRWLFGAPFGQSYDRFVNGQATSIGPHSAYVQALLRVGLIGTSLIVGLLAVIARSGWRGCAPASAVCISIAVYWTTYGFNFEQGVTLAVCLVAPALLSTEKSLQDAQVSS